MRIFRVLLGLALAGTLIAAPVTLDTRGSTVTVQKAYAVDVQPAWYKGTQFFDAAGSPIDSGTINIYDAGTTSLRTTYSDADGTVANTLNGSNQIVLDGEGRLGETVYVPTGRWKFVLRDSGGTTIATEDNIAGSLAFSTFLTGSASWVAPVISKTSAYTVTSADLGKCITVNPTGGSFTLTLISAASAGDGQTLCIRHTGTTNRVTIATVSNESIKHFSTGGASRRSWVLSEENQAITLVSDGADWHALNTTWGPAQQHIFQVEDDGLNAPPSSPTAGAWYIAAATPSGDWAAFSQHDLIQADGAGGWLKLTPSAEGWLAYVRDEDALHFYNGSAWVALPNSAAPLTSDVDVAVYTARQDDGTDNATGIASTWTAYSVNVETLDSGIGGSINGNQVTLPTGSYCLSGNAIFIQTNSTRIRWQNITTTTTAVLGQMQDVEATNAPRAELTMFGCFTVAAATEVFEFQYWIESGGVGRLGSASVETGTEEIYGQVLIWDRASLQGPIGQTGAQGAQGSDGLAGLQYNFDTDTDFDANGEVDSGDVEFNDATISNVTAIGLSDSDRNAADISAFLATWDDSDSAIRGHIVVQEASTPANVAIFTITGASTDVTSHWSLSVTHIASNGTFALNDDVNVFFVRTGDQGDAGADGAAGATGPTGAAGPTVALGWNFDNVTTDADPGAGDFRLNNGTIASATQVFIDNAERGGTTVTSFLDTWDDNGDASGRGTLLLIDPSDSTTFHLFTVTGSVVDGTGYRKVTIAHLAGNGTFTNGNEVSVYFMAFGPAGSGLASVLDDTTPQLGGHLDMNAQAIDFPSTANISDVKDEDNMASDSATMLATQQSIKAYVDTEVATQIANVVEDTTPQLGGQLDVNGNPIGDGTRELLTFTEDASAVNQLNIENEATGSGPTLRASGDDTNIALNVETKGTGSLNLRIGSTTELAISGSAVNAGNGATFQEGGTDISPIGQHTVWVPANAMTARTTNGPATGSLETTTNKVMVETLDFDAAADEFAQFSILMPKGWDAGTVILQFVHKSTETSGNVVWAGQGVCFANDNAPDAAFGTAVTVTDAAGSAAEDIMISAETAAMTLAGSPAAEEWCVYQIYRDADNGSDTKSNDADLIGVRVHLNMDAANDN